MELEAERKTVFGRLAGPAALWGLAAAAWGGAVLIYSLWGRDLVALESPFRLPWWLLAMAFYGAELAVVHVAFRHNAHSFSLTEIPLVLGLFFAAPGELLLGSVIGVGCALAINRRQSPLKLVYNLGHFLLQTSVSVVVFHALIGASDPGGIHGWGAALVVTLMNTVVADIFINTAIRLSGGGIDARRWLRLFALGAVCAVGNTCLALVATTSLWRDAASGWLLIVPALVVFGAYRAYAAERRRRESLQLLHKASREAQGAMEVEKTMLPLLAHMRALFKVDVIEIALFASGPNAEPMRATVGPGDLVRDLAPLPREEFGRWTAELGARALVSSVRSPMGGFQDYLSTRGFKDGMAIGLHEEDKLIGLLLVADHLSDVMSFDADDIQLFETLAGQISISLDRGRLNHSVVELSKEIVERKRVEEQREALERQLRQAQRMEALGHLAGGVAHDFNNLLSIIQNYARFVQESLPPGNASHDDIVEVLMASERAAGLVRQLLLFSRKQALRPEIFDLNMLIRDFDQTLRLTLRDNIAHVLRLDDEPCLVLADSGHVEQILLNLAINAQDAMPNGGEVIIESARTELDATTAKGLGVAPGLYVRLAVSDSGIGMTPEILQHVFEPFFTTKGRATNSGLGLATVHGAVTGAGGAIDVTSVPGTGTTFEIYLPAGAEEAPEDTPKASVETTEANV